MEGENVGGKKESGLLPVKKGDEKWNEKGRLDP